MRILTGRSDSGKTRTILAEIAARAAKNEGRQLLIVPELFSHAYERRLAEATANQGARTAEVLTFSRLTGRVFAETGGLADVPLTPAGRLLTLTEAARLVEHDLAVYPDLADKPEIVREMLRVIDECKTCAVTPERLFAAADELDADNCALADKTRDLGRLYLAYDRLCENGLSDPRDRLTRMADALTDCRALDGVDIYIDAFGSFTPQEVRVIDALLAKGLKLTFGVTSDPAQEDIFRSGCKTVKLLRRMAARHDQPCEVIDLGASRRARPHDLAVLEAEGLLPCGTPSPSDGESVCIFYAATPYEECAHAAAYIRRKVRETGARWRDFVVAARDGDAYAAALEMAMARFDVPIFISEKTDLLATPPLALVTGALAVVTNGWRYEDVFGCFKTGLCSLTPDEIDRLENYALVWRVRGGAWLCEFEGHPDGYGLPFDDAARKTLDELNALRASAAAPFAALESALRDAHCAREYVQALYDFLLEVGAPARMEQRAAAHETAGRLQMADEYRQLWDILVGAMEEMCAVCGGAEMDEKRFAALFSLVLGEYDVASIPVSLDRVTCGSIDRVCHEGARHLILLGVNDGVLPKAPTPGGVLTDSDRLTLEGVGLELSASGAERMLMEQETIYKALSCPYESLLLSCHMAGADGKEQRPSYLLAAFRERLTGLPVESGAACAALDSLTADRPAADLACAALSDAGTPAARAALAYYDKDERLHRARTQRRGRGPLTSRATVDGLYGKSLRLTASRVDQFYSCRFAFFMNYGLKARPRRVAQFAAPETGTFIHFVLENTLNALAREPGGAAAAEPARAHELMRGFVKQYVQESLGGMENKTARFRYLFSRLERAMKSILDNVLDELRNSDFAPIDYELDFSPDGDLPPVVCADADGEVALRGKVDRVDGYIKNGRLYIRVMDYKSGKKSFSLSDVWNGLNMQLIIYLYALQNEGLDRYRERLERELNEIVPAGVLYVPARDELIETDGADVDEDTLRALREKALRRSGLVSDDLGVIEAMEHGLTGDGRFIPVKFKAVKPTKKNPNPAPEFAAASAVANLAQFGQLARFAQGKLLEMGHELRRGNVEANPCRHGQGSYCDWCEFRAACRFDESAGDRVRGLQKVTDAEFWEKTKGAGRDAALD